MDNEYYTDELDTTSIRLLEISLQPDSEDQSCRVLSLTVNRHSLNKPPTYYALTYTWGPPSPGDDEYTDADKITIQFNGRPFKVFPNLHDALLQLYQSYPGMPFWIDAICIDQSHCAERETQVGIMGQIYKQARKVIIWLGKKGHSIDRGVALIRLYAEAAIREVPRILEGQQFIFAIDITKPESLVRYGLPRLTLQDAEDLISLYHSNWFHRIWIIQEVALAKEAVAHWGDTSVPWDDLGIVALFLQISSIASGISILFSGAFPAIKEVDAVGIGFLGAMRIHLVREWCRGGQGPLQDALEFIEFVPGISGTGVSILLLKLILWTRVSFQASDRRDCVYGFLGILNHVFGDGKIPGRLRADYSTGAAEVTLRVTTELLEATGSLQLLGWVCDPVLRENPGNPSWVPDLSPTIAANPMIGPSLKRMVAGDSLFHASTTTNRPEKVFRIEGRKLHVYGQKVGVVRMTGEELDEVLHGKLCDWAEMMLAMAPTYKPTKQSRGDAFRRTIIMDQDAIHRPAHLEVLVNLQKAATWMICNAAQQALDADASADVRQFLDKQNNVFLAAEQVQDCLLPTRAMVEECCIKWGILPETKQTKRLDGEEKRLWLLNFRAQSLSIAGLPLVEALGHRRPFLLKNWYLGCGHKSTLRGDEIWIVSGCPTPLMLRRLEGKGVYSLIGEAYVHGIMHGEFVDAEASWERLCLV
jgi:hypothetical protein